MRRLGLTTAVALLALSVLTTAALAGLGRNPANDPALIDKPIEGYRYDGATRCTSKVPPGTKALVRWLERHTDGESWGITRCEKLSSETLSLHSEGRAIDWHMDARNRSMKRQAMELIRERLLATDRRGNENALARRMGVQGIIYNCRAWWSHSGGLGPYSLCYTDGGRRKRHIDPTAAHVDHIHIELNRAGGRKNTSFWRSPLARR